MYENEKYPREVDKDITETNEESNKFYTNSIRQAALKHSRVYVPLLSPRNSVVIYMVTGHLWRSIYLFYLLPSLLIRLQWNEVKLVDQSTEETGSEIRSLSQKTNYIKFI